MEVIKNCLAWGLGIGIIVFLVTLSVLSAIALFSWTQDRLRG